MWRSAKDLMGYEAETTDGTRAPVEDFYFDDHHWSVRYAVLSTGSWLTGRQVLAAPNTFGDTDEATHTLRLTLSKKQVENSPPISSDRPVSRQQEAALATYYGWTPYWTVPPLAGTGFTQNLPGVTPVPSFEQRRLAAGNWKGDPHLRSVQEVTGYRLEAKDGDIGRVTDVIVSNDDWSVRFLVADTGSWLTNHPVLLSPHWIEAIRWEDRHVSLDLTREQIRRSPSYNPTEPVNGDLERQLFDYYGRPHPLPLGAPASR